MVRTRWTKKNKKKKRTKPLKDITSPSLKEVSLIETNPNEDEDNSNYIDTEMNPVGDEENEKDANRDEDEENENDDNPLEDDEKEKEPNPVENEVEEEEERSEEEEANLDENEIEENEENSGEEEERSEEEENYAVEEEEGTNFQSNDEGHREEGSNSQTISEDSIEEALKPMAMYFPPSEYRKKIKISTRCFIADVMKTFKELDPPLSRREKIWFENHPQFKHIFHMPQDGNHKVMGMWMLFLRTARIEKEKEAWFVINGCPIRYGIREHALISGLNCRNYPLNYNLAGDTKFVRRCFGNRIVRYQDVKAKVLEGIELSVDRLRLLFLYFLSSVIAGQRKTGDDAPSVDPFLLRVVDDLNMCKSFPWGRLSFDNMMKEISHTMDHFDGEVKKEGLIWPIPGFCIPMELLAFEAIAQLGVKFRERGEDFDPTCPRMCQSKFKRSEMKRFPLSKINKELGNTKEIENILTTTDEEDTLLGWITEEEDIRDKDDVVVESWMKRLASGNVIRFDDMLEEDVAAREAHPPENGVNETEATNEAAENTVKLNELVEIFKSFKEDIGERMKRIEEKVEDFNIRLAASEAYVHEKLDARGADVEEEERGVKRTGTTMDDNSKRPKKRSKKKNEIVVGLG